jgi:hypothetical protein
VPLLLQMHQQVHQQQRAAHTGTASCRGLLLLLLLLLSTAGVKHGHTWRGGWRGSREVTTESPSDSESEDGVCA